MRQNLGAELARREDGRIDVSSESLLSAGQCSDNILKGRGPHDEQVDIA